jgi:hypothetical protein
MADQGSSLSAMPGDPQMGKVYDNTVAYSALAKNTAQFQQTDPAGAAIANGEGRIPTYSAATAAYSTPSPIGDLLAIFGSSTKTVRVKRIGVSGRSTSAGQLDVQVIKRTTAWSGSTSAALTAAPHDSTIDPAATAQIVTYSSSGSTSGFGGVTVRAQQANTSAAGSGGAAVPVEWHFGDVNDQSFVLRSTSEAYCINCGSTAPGGTVLNMFVEWSEE